MPPLTFTINTNAPSRDEAKGVRYFVLTATSLTPGKDSDNDSLHELAVQRNPR